MSQPTDGQERPNDRTGSVDTWIGEGVLVCPDCHGRLTAASDADRPIVTCFDCSRSYPVLDGIPALFTTRSAFAAVAESPPTESSSPDEGRGTYFESKLSESPFKRRLRRALPTLAKDHGAARVDTMLRQALSALEVEQPRGLVVGAGERPEATAERLPEARWLASDVDTGFQPTLLADVQELPVADGALDVAVAEMVLEHVMNPIQAARELERVVRPGGLLLVTIPFCFPWHGIPIDFFRCTPAGLRALFRHTEVLHLDRGMGPWGGVAYALDAALTNLTNVRTLRRATVMLSRFAFGGLAALDRLRLDGGRGLVNPASITYLARRVAQPKSDAEILDELRQRFGDGPG